MIVASLCSVKDLNLSVEDHIISLNLHTSYTPLSFFDERTLIENQNFKCHLCTASVLTWYLLEVI